MMFMIKAVTSSLLFATLLSACIDSVDGVCLPCNSMSSDLHPGPARRDVYNPKITYPTDSTTWYTGHQVTVTWDASNIPNTSNPKGKLVLGRIQKGSESEHLDIDHPLASGFDLHREKVDITVPEVPPGSGYIVVLMGDSGNRSPTFTILR